MLLDSYASDEPVLCMVRGRLNGPRQCIVASRPGEPLYQDQHPPCSALAPNGSVTMFPLALTVEDRSQIVSAALLPALGNRNDGHRHLL